MSLKERIRPAIIAKVLLLSALTFLLLHRLPSRTGWQFIEWEMIYLFLWIGLTGAIVITNRENWKSMVVLTLPSIAFILVLWMRAITFVMSDIQSYFVLPVMAFLYWLIVWGSRKANKIQSWWRAQLYGLTILTCLVIFSLLYGPVVASRPWFVSLVGLILSAALVYAFPRLVWKVEKGLQRRRVRGALILSFLAIFTIFWYPWRSEEKFKYPAWYYAHYLTPRPLLTRWYGALYLRSTPRVFLTVCHSWSTELNYPWWTPDSKLSLLFEDGLLKRLEHFGERKFETTWGDDALWVAIVRDSKKPRPPHPLTYMPWRYGIGKVKEEKEVQIESWTLAGFGYASTRSPGLTVPELLYWYALHCKNRGEEERAILFCQKALEEAKTPWWVSPHLTIANIHKERGNTEAAITLLDGLLRQIPLPKYEGDIDEIKSIAHALSYFHEEQGDDSTARLFYAYYRHNRRGDVIESGYETKPASEAKRQTFLLLRESLHSPQRFLREIQNPKYRPGPVPVSPAESPFIPLPDFMLYDTPPEIVERVEPVYPETVRKLIWSPVVILKVLVNEKGEVDQAVVLQSCSEACDSAAVRAVRAARFSPAKMKGKPVRAWISFPVKFRFPSLED